MEMNFDLSQFSFESVSAWMQNFLTLPNLVALMGVIAFVATHLMRTIVPLRICAVIGNLFFVVYGVLSHSFNTFSLYAALVIINLVRLYQMVHLVGKARESARGNLSMDWLKPFMRRRSYRAGDVLFRKGDIAKELFFTVTGRFIVKEIGSELPPGRIVGELGFLSPDNRRTQSVECAADGDVLAITYEKLLEIYFQNPEFGYYLLRVSSERLLQNVSRLEGLVQQYKAELDALGAKR
ncbi:MAG: Crp/Fnr family transcriptional regulator [Xanthobacteraceae bacterium]